MSYLGKLFNTLGLGSIVGAVQAQKDQRGRGGNSHEQMIADQEKEEKMRVEREELERRQAQQELANKELEQRHAQERVCVCVLRG